MGVRFTASDDAFAARHIGPDADDEAAMLRDIGVASLDRLIDETVPADIRFSGALDLPAPVGEAAVLDELRALAAKNQVWKSYIGMGYADCFTPPVILRNILENPGWYTQYTPYQAEISQGRLEALLNFQTMVADLTGLPIANASLLDEATAAAEAMHMLYGVAPAMDKDDGGESGAAFLVADNCHPQTIEVVRTRAKPLGIEVRVGDATKFDFATGRVFGALVQYPATDGAVSDWRELTQRAHDAGALVAMATDLLALTVLTPPGELGADVAIGSAQRFGVPLGYGGPHAAFFATRAEWVRKMPGRLIGVSQDAHGQMALRMALQTREQHIRREKATSNICTAQVLLAVIAGMYAVYHGPRGLRAIAERIGHLAGMLAASLIKMGERVVHRRFFDTVRVDGSAGDVERWLKAAAERRINLRHLSDTAVTIALDETTTEDDLGSILKIFAAIPTEFDGFVADFSQPEGEARLQEILAEHRHVAERQRAGAEAYKGVRFADVLKDFEVPWAGSERQSAYLLHPVFNRHHSETEMLRYMRRLENRDLSLTHSMIPLGSCTMKLNATVEMLPVTWPEWGRLHPFAPPSQTEGYRALFTDLERMLCAITGFAATSLQPNAGSQGEYAGLLVIRAFHDSRGQGHRDVCLIPSSAHGTNPASAVMAGYRVVVVACDDGGNVDLADLEAKARAHADRLAALMVTYPSTHGVFEPGIRRICEVVHAHGGQVYMDGANLNAQVGLCRPGDIGADVCHINLHKTFCIPHGGGGPGMGPISVAAHLAPFLPGHPIVATGGAQAIGPVSAAPWGSASILLISWTYIRLMGAAGLARASKVAILNANYIAKRLDDHYPVVYKGAAGRVAHECIVDVRPVKKTAGVEVDDVAKRLMDYGFHAPTMSFPIPGTLMIEPTESESKAELDRFCEAMIAIRAEIAEVEAGAAPREGNLLKNAPHTAAALLAAEWPHPYPRERAAYPLPYVRAAKFWPPVGRLDNVLGDRKLHCSCPDISEYG